MDSENQMENDMAPILNIFNGFYAKNTSRKIRAVFKAKGQSGKPLRNHPPYGYAKDPEDKTRWIVDEEAAEIARGIFRLCMQGYGHEEVTGGDEPQPAGRAELHRGNSPTPITGKRHSHTRRLCRILQNQESLRKTAFLRGRFSTKWGTLR